VGMMVGLVSRWLRDERGLVWAVSFGLGLPLPPGGRDVGG